MESIRECFEQFRRIIAIDTKVFPHSGTGMYLGIAEP
jgi:hypothetical protein